MNKDKGATEGRMETKERPDSQDEVQEYRAATRRVFWPEAYAAGLQSGRADRQLGVSEEYAWNVTTAEPAYTYNWHYSRGYRDGYGG